MPIITFDVPVRAITAICTRRGYQVTIDGIPNPQTPVQFFKVQIGQYIKAETLEHEANTAAATAAANVRADIESNLNIT